MLDIIRQTASIARLKADSDTWTANNATLSAQDSNLVAYWKAEDLTDSIGSNTLTNNGTATFTSGKNNNAFTLNGSNQYLSASDSDDFNFGTGDFTMSLMVKFSSVPSNDSMSLICQRDDGSNFFGLYIGDTEGQKYVVFSAWDGTETIFLQGNTTLSTGVWYNMVISRIGNVWTIYQDTTPLDTDTQSGSMPDLSSNLDIGRWSTGIWYVNGQIDEVSIWKGYGANQTFVDALYNSGTGAFLV